jgi:hypothetical protein
MLHHVSNAGRYMYRKGALVPTSLDLYLALEFCDQGDLYHMRGQVPMQGLLCFCHIMLCVLQWTSWTSSKMSSTPC